MRKIILLVVIILLGINLMTVLAQEKQLRGVDDANRLSDDVMNLLENGRKTAALILIEKNIQDPEIEKFEVVKADFKGFLTSATEQYGELIGVDFAKEEKVSDFLLRYTYALKHKEQPVWMRFTYYFNNEKYTLKKFDWGEDIKMLF